MAFAVSKQGCSAFLAVSAAIAGRSDRISPGVGDRTFSILSAAPVFFRISDRRGCFDIAAVCVTPGTFTLTSAVSTFLPAVQDISANATFTGSLTPLPPASGSLGTFTLSGTVDLSVLGRMSDAETGSWTTEITGLSLTGPC